MKYFSSYTFNSIGLRTESEYPGIFQWNRLKTAEIDANANAEALSFHNWDGAATGTGECVAMTAGVSDPKNGRWSIVECSSASTLYGICEHAPENE